MLSAGSALSLLGRKALPAGSHRLRFPAGVTVLRETELVGMLVGMIIMDGNYHPKISVLFLK